jgi:DNA-binding transcriptional LysR family regulator
MDRLASIAAFVRVVENGGFTAAARHLNVSPTMVSNQVQELEDRLGARLFLSSLSGAMNRLFSARRAQDSGRTFPFPELLSRGGLY